MATPTFGVASMCAVSGIHRPPAFFTCGYEPFGGRELHTRADAEFVFLGSAIAINVAFLVVRRRSVLPPAR